MKNDTVRRVLAWGLALAIALPAAAWPTAKAAKSADADAAARTAGTEGLNAAQMTALWFGDSETVSLFGDEGTNTPEGAVSAYFSARQEDYSPADAARLFGEEDLPASDRVLRERARRERQIADMQERLDIAITGASVTVKLDPKSVSVLPDGTVEAYAYEWTFYDYDDLSDGPGGNDVSGYGTWHRLLLKKGEDGGYVIVSDEYDETDILDLNTIRPATRKDPAASAKLPDHMADPQDTWDEETAGGEELASLMDAEGIEFFEDYDLDAMAAYSDKYCLNYNPAYYNFNPVGGDCANFTSQSIYAGGMPQVKGKQYGSDGWFYVTASNRSGTWTSAAMLCAWMGTHRGNEVLASASSVYKGSPCFYNNKHHATICVGQNSAGVPIINSHNSDRYHVKWNYWTPTEIITVQLTKGSVGPLSISGAQYPSGTLPKGEGYGLRGVIRSDHTITRVSAAVYDSEGNAVLSHVQTWNSTSYDIRRDGINDAIVFDELDTGDYTYAVTASDASGTTKTLVEAAFSVGGSTLGITGAVYPSGTLKRGGSQDLAGVISSNYPLTTVNAYVFDTSDSAVMTYRWTGNGSAKSYNISTGGLDDAFLFGSLPDGRYSYSVSATDASGTTKRLLHSDFTVEAGTVTLTAPAVSVSGSGVSLTWPSVSGASKYTAYLIQEPWGWDDVKYTGTVTSPAHTFTGVSAGDYRAFYTVQTSGGRVQSPWTNLSVGEAVLTLSGWLDGKAAGDLGSYGTADVSVSGSPDAVGVNAYRKAWPAGTAYEITNIRPAEGYAYYGVRSGSRTGVLGTEDAAVSLEFVSLAEVDSAGAYRAGTYGGNEYRLYTDAVTWYEAKAVCAAAGGHLAVVTDAEEQAFIQSLCGSDGAWLGGTDADAEDTWTWVSGEPFTYTSWTPLQPDDSGDNDEGGEDYLYLTAGGQWDDAPGCRRLPFLCEIEGAAPEEPAVPAAPAPLALSYRGFQTREGSVSFTAVVSNSGDGLASGTVLAALYDGERMAACKAAGVSAAAGDHGDAFFTLAAPAGGTYAVRLFLLDSGNGTPLAASITVS